MPSWASPPLVALSIFGNLDTSSYRDFGGPTPLIEHGAVGGDSLFPIFVVTEPSEPLPLDHAASPSRSAPF